MDCLGPFAKVENCPIAGTTIRRTCYATGYADTYFSVPACMRFRGRYVRGYFTTPTESASDFPGSVEFRPMSFELHKLQEVLDF